MYFNSRPVEKRNFTYPTCI